MDIDTMQELLEKAAQRDPRQHRHGVYSVGPAHAMAGIFFWFDDPRAMARGIVMAAAIDDDPEPAELAERFAAADKAAGAVRDECTAVLQHLDGRLCWAGSYEALAAGDGEFARSLREEFRALMEDDEDEIHDGPVEVDEVESRLEHLQSFGH